MLEKPKKFLLAEDRGVSPVIGVILMVAITVILAAVIATFVMNMGPSEETQPNVQWEWNYDDPGSGSDSVTLSHTGGDAATTGEFVIEIEGASSATDDPDGEYNLDASAFGHTDEMTASDSVEITQGNLETISGSVTYDSLDLSSATITLIWENPNNDQTQQVDTYEP